MALIILESALICLVAASGDDFINFAVTLDNPPVRGIVANNSGRATGVAISDGDEFSIGGALILSTLAHAAFGLGWSLCLILFVTWMFCVCFVVMQKLMHVVARRWTPQRHTGPKAS